LGLNFRTGLDPGTTVVRSHPLSLLLDVEPAKDEQPYGEQRPENKSEGNNLPAVRNGY
jgi:hypothetical protein